ncbi:MAG: type II toxin-antitoxin system RelE/ParE family toxin [Opitutales bacterium]|nr:type II toxin-antitoxin system RelE/ParE family toxin [Opitutales bacterium]
MGNYSIQIRRSAENEIERLPTRDQKKVIEKIRSLRQDPRPSGVKKLSGEEKYRLRQGSYRILYEVHDAMVTVVVVKVADRKDAYR